MSANSPTVNTSSANSSSANSSSANSSSANSRAAARPSASRSKTAISDPGQDRSREARRVAAAVLEVLAGARTPSEAAAALSMSVPYYYHVESRALRGLVAACEPKPKGRVRSTESEVTALRQENQRLQRDLARQQALVRASQRSVGLSPPVAPSPGKKSAKKIRKRKTARALSMAARLQQDPDPDVAAAAIVPTTSAASS